MQPFGYITSVLSHNALRMLIQIRLFLAWTLYSCEQNAVLLLWSRSTKTQYNYELPDIRAGAFVNCGLHYV